MRIQSLLALACIGFAAARTECTQEDVDVYCLENHFCCATATGNEGICTPEFDGCANDFFHGYMQENGAPKNVTIASDDEEVVPRKRHNRGQWKEGGPIRKMVKKAKDFFAEHKKPLVIAAGVLAIYFIYTRFFAAPTTVAPKKTTASCTCTCKNNQQVIPASVEKIQYTLWNPPTVVEHEPLV